ncbi:MAG: metal-dependent hydrolase [Caldisericia bacterium]
MAIIPLAPNVNPKLVGREQTIREIKKTIDLGSSFIVTGQRGSGKTKIISDVITPHLDSLSLRIWGIESTKKIYWPTRHCELDNSAGLRALLSYLNFTFELHLDPIPKEEDMEYELWLATVCYNLKMVRASHKMQVYLIIDEIEKLAGREIATLSRLLHYAAIIGASRPTRTNIKVMSFFENISYVKFTLGPLSRPQAEELFYDVLSQSGLNNIGQGLITFLKTRLMNQILYPQAIVYPIVESLARTAQTETVTKKTLRDLRLHKSGFETADLTMAFFIIIFGFLFMRAISMRGPESYKYGIYMFSSLAAMWAWRIMSRKIQTNEKETDVVVNVSEDEEPKWYRKIAGLVGIMTHILASWILLLIIFLFLGQELKLSYLILAASSTIMPDIDHEYSTISKIFRFFVHPFVIIFKFLRIPIPLNKIENIPSWIEMHWGHRNVMHWATTWLIFSVISFIPFHYFKIGSLNFVSFSFGYLFHSFYDAVSPSGVAITGPSQVKWVTPPGYSMRVRVGSLREGVVCIVFGIIFLLLSPLAIFTPAGFVQMFVKNPDAATGETRKQILDKRVFIAISGKYIATQMPINNEEFECVNNLGATLYLLKDKIVYKYAGMGGGGDIDSMKMLNTRYGDRPIQIVTRKIEVSYLTSFEQLFYDIKEDEFITGKMQISGTPFLLSPILTGISFSGVVIRPKEAQNNMIMDISLDCATRAMIRAFLDKGAIVTNADILLFERREM